jgi:hypothetical protein
MDPSNFWTVAWVFFGICHLPILIMTGWKMYVWSCRHPKALMGSVYMYKLILNLALIFFEAWSTVIFWLLFAIAASFYFFFKLDQAPYLVMPHDEDSNLLPFAVIFGIVFAVKLIIIFAKLIKQ